MKTAMAKRPAKTKAFALKDLPAVNLFHIRNLTDDTGMIQHAIFNIPNRKEGYCIDDNARALLLSVLAHKNKIGESEMPPLHGLPKLYSLHANKQWRV